MSFVNLRRTLCSLSFALVLCPLSVFSGERTQLSELDYLNDLPVTFSATRLPQTLNEAPASITIIDRRMIDASSATTISELFRLVPGMQSYHIATNASAVAYHGMSDKFPSRMEVMIDGQSVYIPLFSAVIWESLPISIDDIERIEVVRGTNTVTQGSNAFLGAINIITHSALSSRENIIKYQQGEFDNRTVYSRYSASHELGYFSVSAGITGNDGNQFISGNSDPYFNRHFTFNTSISPTLLDTFTINLGANSGYSSVGDITSQHDNPNLPDPQRREFQSFFQNMEWKHLLNNQNELKARYSHSLTDYSAAPLSVADARVKYTDRVAIDNGLPEIYREALGQAFLDANPYRVTSEFGNIEQHQLELSFKSTPSDFDQLLTGAEYNYQAARNYQMFDTHNMISEDSYRLFAHWENTLIPDWTFNLGASAEHGGHNSTRVSPRLAVNYQLNSDITLRSSANRAYRMPSLLESNSSIKVYTPALTLPNGNLQDLFGAVFDTVYEPNPKLKPEQLDSIDLGMLIAWPQYNSDLDMRLFYEEINNGITETKREGDNDGTLTYTNMSEWTNKGIELQLKYQGNSRYKPLIILNYGYIQSSGYRILDERTSDNYDHYWHDSLDTRNPVHTGSLLTSVTLPENLKISLSHYFLSSVRWIEATRKDYGPANKAYHRTDLKVSKSFRVSDNNNLELSLIVQNLLDKPYSEFYAENMFEQRTYLQAQLSF
ncbi:TonB-dependent receptor [uncultured Amphritea sp.]|uniref:TonB-dependent receptor plug domain-containing protein n=1 Tax=uncultured Amphritea sp. TaxID=981605 RepID=UPI00260CF355|nr:TonB-dependent receptor [uncultured Amphritea sp.]